jgi:hypothetical protein
MVNQVLLVLRSELGEIFHLGCRVGDPSLVLTDLLVERPNGALQLIWRLFEELLKLTCVPSTLLCNLGCPLCGKELQQSLKNFLQLALHLLFAIQIVASTRAIGCEHKYGVLH